MHRRSVLTAVAVLPATICSQASAGPIEFDQCLECSGPWPENVWEWTEDMRRARMNLGRAYGLKVLTWPPDALVAASISDPQVRAQYTPGQFADLGDLANSFGVGGGLGTLSGGYVAASRGMMLGGLFGLGAGLAFWAGWNVGTGIYQLMSGRWSAVIFLNR